MIENLRGPTLGLPPGVDPARSVPGVSPAKAVPDPRGPELGEQGFKSQLRELLGEVSEIQKSAGDAAQAVVRGEPIELHEVLIRQEEARIAFHLLLETRNRLVEAYQEIMRMQV
jgi:flagellar hook-basal body complex protein FliE